MPLAVSPLAQPFRHFVWTDFADAEAAERALAGLESTEVWTSGANDEYSHFLELSLRRHDLPFLAPLTGSACLNEVRDAFARAFGVPFADEVGVTVHRMESGSRVRVHTDHGVEPVTHRLVLHLNRGWDVDQGGLLLLLDAEHRNDLHDAHRYYVPTHRLAVGFEISPRSYHAVSEVLQGSRYTVCYSLRATGAVCDDPF